MRMQVFLDYCHKESTDSRIAAGLQLSQRFRFKIK